MELTEGKERPSPPKMNMTDNFRDLSEETNELYKQFNDHEKQNTI